MKIINLFLPVVLFIFTGCYMGAKTYKVFENLNNDFISNKRSLNVFGRYYIKQDYNETEYIYKIDYEQSSRNIPKECIFGFITRKDDPKQIPIRWEILSGKEHCKEQQQWILSF